MTMILVGGRVGWEGIRILVKLRLCDEVRWGGGGLKRIWRSTKVK